MYAYLDKRNGEEEERGGRREERKGGFSLATITSQNSEQPLLSHKKSSLCLFAFSLSLASLSELYLVLHQVRSCEPGAELQRAVLLREGNARELREKPRRSCSERDGPLSAVKLTLLFPPPLLLPSRHRTCPRSLCDRDRECFLYSYRGSRAFRGGAWAGNESAFFFQLRRGAKPKPWRAKFMRGGAGVSALGGDQAAVYSTVSRFLWSC
jgi:hypothetical protein